MGWSRQSPETEADFDFTTALIKQPPKNPSLEQWSWLGMEGSGWARTTEEGGQRKGYKFHMKNEGMSRDNSSVSLPKQKANTTSLPRICKILLCPKRVQERTWNKLPISI